MVERVTVYNFWTIDLDSGERSFSPFKATPQAAERLYGSEVISDTREVVRSDELDERGRYRRLPTGWAIPNRPAGR